ncbi:MAG TPA: glutathione S-transferase family protein [Burkholderiales bacterium]|nr:glutathione S-transferase family protein [Burkholderiales bacterium]
MADITFFTNPQSRGRIVRWMLEELGEQYDTVLLEFGASMKSPTYLAVNPMGKVPAIRHRGAVVTEAAAICVYLADSFPGRKLAPPPADRAAYYRWIFFAAGPLEAALTGKALGFSSDKKQMLGYGSYEDTVNALELAVSAGPFICGDRFTAADVYVGSQVAWGMMFGTLEKRPAFEAYSARLRERPAARRAHELDEAAAKKG